MLVLVLHGVVKQNSPDNLIGKGSTYVCGNVSGETGEWGFGHFL